MGNTLTDELRLLISLYGWKDKTDADIFMTAADTIDEQHKRECREQYARGNWHGIGASIEASMIQDHGYIELPKDADGEPIRIGDVMEWPNGETFEVIGIGDDLLFYVEGNDDVIADWTIASTKRHHAATVEDVLREFTDAILEWSAKSGTVAEVGTWSDVAAEYAAKIQLREES